MNAGGRAPQAFQQQLWDFNNPIKGFPVYLDTILYTRLLGKKRSNAFCLSPGGALL